LRAISLTEGLKIRPTIPVGEICWIVSKAPLQAWKTEIYWIKNCTGNFSTAQGVGGAKVSFWRKLIENQSCDEY